MYDTATTKSAPVSHIISQHVTLHVSMQSCYKCTLALYTQLALTVQYVYHVLRALYGNPGACVKKIQLLELLYCSTVYVCIT
jgi:hypothetical protein